MKFENRVFNKESIALSGNEYHHCKFIECDMQFSGIGNVALTHNEFNSCRWTFIGPASETISFMKAMYRMGGGGKELILATLYQIAPELDRKH